MRITDSYTNENLTINLQTTLQKLNELQEKLVTGKDINKPSDSPVKAARLINIKDSISHINQYRENLDETVKFMEATETALKTMTDVFNDVKSIAIRGKNATYTVEDKQKMAIEVDNKLKEIISIANTQLEGRYIFAGFKIQTKPFSEVLTGDTISDVNYNGDNGLMPEEVYKGEIINKNIPGDVFKNGGMDIFKTLIDLRDHLNNNDVNSLDNDIDNIDNTLSKILEIRADIGGKLKRTENISTRIIETKNTLEKFESNIEDIDMPEILTKFQLQQNVYQAAIQSISRILNEMNLADVLR